MRHDSRNSTLIATPGYEKQTLANFVIKNRRKLLSILKLGGAPAHFVREDLLLERFDKLREGRELS